MSDHALVDGLRNLETGIGDEAANYILALERRLSRFRKPQKLERRVEELEQVIRDMHEGKAVDVRKIAGIFPTPSQEQESGE